MITENRYELTLTISMSARYHHLCEGFYLRVNDLSLFCNLVLGSAAIGGVLGHVPALAVAAGAAVSIISALNITMGTTRKAQAHREQYRRYRELDARQAELGDGGLVAAMRSIERDDAPVIEAFRKRAYLDNLLRHGHTEEAARAPLRFSVWERLRLALA